MSAIPKARPQSFACLFTPKLYHNHVNTTMVSLFGRFQPQKIIFEEKNVIFVQFFMSKFGENNPRKSF